MAYRDLPAVRRKLEEGLRRDLGVDKGKARQMAEESVRRSAEQIEKAVKDGRRSAT